jgi:galactokinase
VSAGGTASWQPDPPFVARQPDAASFLETIDREAFLDPTRDAVLARAPGRLDVMGGIADYSGSLVLQLPLSLAAFACAQLQPEPAITIRSLQASQLGSGTDMTIPLSAVAPAGIALDYDRATRLFRDTVDPGERAAHQPNEDAGRSGWPRWPACIAGALIVLGRERGIRIDRGVRILVDSQVPLGKGVSSSAAIEVAAMQAIASLYEIPLTGTDLAVLCQMVENRVVGAPCGLMDQMTATLGEQDRLLALLCQPAELLAPVVIPDAFDVWGVDSGVRHAVTGSDYTSVRVGAFMGYRMIADLAGLEARPTPGSALVSITDPHWRGYLANITTAVWHERFRDRIPERMKGDVFLARYGGTTDRVTHVDPARTYAVRNATAHPIHEHERVNRFRALLDEQHPGESTRAAGRGRPTGSVRLATEPATDIGLELGELMDASHTSYGRCGLGSSATDRLAELVREAGPDRGIFGARITGGGSGGTVAILGRRGADHVVRDIANRFRREMGAGGGVLHGSSAGASRSGVVRLVARKGRARA